LFLFQFVLIVAVVDRLCDRRDSRGRHHDQVEAQFLRPSERCGGGHYFCRAIGEYCANLPGTNRFVNVFSATWLSRREITAWNHAVSRLCPNTIISLAVP